MGQPHAIMIHGSGGDHRVWAPLSARVRGAVALDLPGHPDGPAESDLATLGSVVGGALDTINGPRVLVGHSLGGAVALEVARTRPDLVDGLVIISSAARLPVPDTAIARARDDFAAERERLMTGSFSDPDQRIARGAREALDSCGARTLLADYAACRSVDLRGALGEVRAPALLIAGDDDPFTPARFTQELARELAISRMVVIPGARHMPMIEFAPTVAMLLAAFLARLELTGCEE